MTGDKMIAAPGEKTILGVDLRRMITKVVVSFSGKKVKVIFRGSGAYTTGYIVCLPNIRDLAEIPWSVARALVGYAIHEIGHVLLTDWDEVRRSYDEGKLVRQFANAIEDYRIERELCKMFPGATRDLTALRVRIHPDPEKLKPEWLRDPRACGPLALTWTGSVLNGFPNTAMNPTLDAFPPPIRSMIDRWTAKMDGIVDTQEVVNLSIEINKEVEAYIDAAKQAASAEQEKSEDPSDSNSDSADETDASDPQSTPDQNEQDDSENSENQKSDDDSQASDGDETGDDSQESDDSETGDADPSSAEDANQSDDDNGQASDDKSDDDADQAPSDDANQDETSDENTGASDDCANGDQDGDGTDSTDASSSPSEDASQNGADNDEQSADVDEATDASPSPSDSANSNETSDENADSSDNGTSTDQNEDGSEGSSVSEDSESETSEDSSHEGGETDEESSSSDNQPSNGSSDEADEPTSSDGFDNGDQNQDVESNGDASDMNGESSPSSSEPSSPYNDTPESSDSAVDDSSADAANASNSETENPKSSANDANAQGATANDKDVSDQSENNVTDNQNPSDPETSTDNQSNPSEENLDAGLDDFLSPDAAIEDHIDAIREAINDEISQNGALPDQDPEASEGEVDPERVLEEVEKSNSVAPNYQSSDGSEDDDSNVDGENDSPSPKASKHHYNDKRFQELDVECEENLYTALRQSAAGTISTTARTIRRLLASQDKNGTIRNRRDGQFDIRNMGAIIRQTGTCYKRSFEQKGTETLLVTLVDFSGSMLSAWPASKPVPIKLAMTGALAIEEATKNTSINTAIYSYGGCSPTVNLAIFKEGKQNASKTKKAIGSYPNAPSGSTPTGEAMAAVLSRIENSPEERKVLLVLTDGDADDMELCKSVVDVYLRRGIEIIAIGISSDTVKNWAPTYHVINDVAQLPQALLETIDPRGPKKKAA